MVYKKRSSCAICKKNKSLHSILNYNEVPLAGDFPKKEEIGQCLKFNLELLFCDNCCLLQTNSIIDPDILFKDYRYMSSVGLSSHFNQVAAYLVDTFKLNKNSNVLEIGSNDGVLLKPLMEKNINCIGIDPAINICERAKQKGCNVVNDYFNIENVNKYKFNNQFDLIVSNNCFAHIENIHSIVEGIKMALKKDGFFVFEVHYVKNLIEQLQYDNIYHEHLYYYSLTALNNLFKSYKMSIIDYEEIPIHAGSIRVVVKNNGNITEKVLLKLQQEHDEGMDNLKWYLEFADKVKNHIELIKNTIYNIKKEGNTIIGYGASGRANMICNLCNFNSNIINYIIDESEERSGRYISGTDIPILSLEHLDKPDYILIFAWNYAKMIINKLNNPKFKYIVAFPEIKIITDSKEIVHGI